MDLGNPIETVVHHLLIGGMTYLDHRDGFSIVSAHWIGPIGNHNANPSNAMIHQATILHKLSILRGY